MGLLAVCLGIAALALPWPVRLLASTLAALVSVRLFILYHDFCHGSALRNSWFARAVFNGYGLLVLAPSRVWRQTHNHHHAHNAQVEGPHVGTFDIMTTHAYRSATPMQRLGYRLVRHPLMIASGYLTVFVIGLCLLSLWRDPRRHWDSLVSMILHGSLIATIYLCFGFPVLFYALLLPMAMGGAFGAYLFYVQHNFEGVQYFDAHDDWTYSGSALESSSYLKLGPVMAWFTGNIGYHHVHHLNPKIPFYRLPAAMAAIPELQEPNVTTLGMRDVLGAFRLNLWDPDEKRMVSYGYARRKHRMLVRRGGAAA